MIRPGPSKAQIEKGTGRTTTLSFAVLMPDPMLPYTCFASSCEEGPQVKMGRRDLDWLRAGS